MLTRLVLDYEREEYVFPDGRVIGRSVPYLIESGFTVCVKTPSELAAKVEILSRDLKGEDPTHYQAYEISRTGKDRCYSIYFLRLSQDQEPHLVCDEDKLNQQLGLYRKIAG